jgi:hypothetical protein
MKAGHVNQDCDQVLVIRTIVVLMAILLLTSACGMADALNRLTRQIDDTTAQTVATLDDGINLLGDTSADYQKILQDTLSKLPRQAQDFVRNDITNLLRRAPATIGTEFRCNVDFLRIRAREELLRIKSKILGTSFPPSEPQLCSVVPLAVDKALVPNDLKLLEFYGYDFDQLPLQAVLINSSGTVDVTFALARPTHYHMTLNLGANGVSLSPTSQMFALKWNNANQSTISIIQPTTPICQSRVDPVPAGKKITLKPPLAGGDRNFAGHGPKVQANVKLVKQDTHVDVTLSMHAQETKSDWTTVSGSLTDRFFTPDPGRRVDQIIGDLDDQTSYIHGNEPRDVVAAGPGGPVAQWEFSDFEGGNAAGTDTQVTVHFNTVRIVTIETKNCVSPTAYAEVKRLKLLSPLTTQRLDTELLGLHPDILNFQPRFSLPISK